MPRQVATESMLLLATLDRRQDVSCLKPNQAAIDEQATLRQEILTNLLGEMDAVTPPFIDPPFRCDYVSTQCHRATNQCIEAMACALDDLDVEVGNVKLRSMPTCSLSLMSGTAQEGMFRSLPCQCSNCN